MIYITGDTHGKFERIEQFCGKFKTSREDVLIILGCIIRCHEYEESI